MPERLRRSGAFFGGLSFGRIGDPLLTADGVAEVASLEDLLAYKLETILQRAQPKDYEDIAAMLRAGYRSPPGLQECGCSSAGAFSPPRASRHLPTSGTGTCRACLGGTVLP